MLKTLKNGEDCRRVSQLPIDRSDCECRKHVLEVTRSGKLFDHYTCPRSKSEGMKKYEVKCKKCFEIVAYIRATDAKLADWCDLHTVSEARLIEIPVLVDKLVEKEKYVEVQQVEVMRQVGKWFGCLAVNISPINETLGFECACGQDTRDFRASLGLNPVLLTRKIKETMQGRDFGKEDSKFYVKEIK